MIDFRYHVVSLVSVFIALAVGIVLGAGPLNNQIGETLRDQVRQVVNEKKQLHDQLSASETDVKQRDTFLAAVSLQLTNAALAGRSVVLVAVPGVAAADLDASAQAVTAAGGTVTAQITLDANWTAAGESTRRQSALTQLTGVDPQIIASADTQGELAATLARTVTSSGTAPEAVMNANEVKAVEILKSAQLISVQGTLKQKAYGAIVLAPEVATTTTATASPHASPVTTTGQVHAWTQLVGAMDARNGGTVVLGPSTAADDGGLIAAIREDKVASTKVSTVDEGATPMGEITMVLALRQQFLGLAGAYGYGNGASGPMPGVTQ